MFELKKEAKWYIYGANDLALELMRILQKNGVGPMGIIDQYKEEKYYEGVAIVKPNELASMGENIVITALQSIVSTNQAVDVLQQHTDRIIFPCGGGSYEKTWADHNRRIYAVIKNSGSIPFGEKLFTLQELKDICKSGIVRDYGEKIVCYIPIELIYARENDARTIEDEVVRSAIRRNSGIWLPLADDLNALMDYLIDGDKSKVDLYCERYSRMRGKTKEEVLWDRMELFKIWKHELSCGDQYFVDAAASAKWKNDRFHIEDGAHRVMFLYRSGRERIPLCMTREDFQLYCRKISEERKSRR